MPILDLTKLLPVKKIDLLKIPDHFCEIITLVCNNDLNMLKRKQKWKKIRIISILISKYTRWCQVNQSSAWNQETSKAYLAHLVLLLSWQFYADMTCFSGQSNSPFFPSVVMKCTLLLPRLKIWTKTDLCSTFLRLAGYHREQKLMVLYICAFSI